MTCHADLLDIEGLFTQRSRPGMTSPDSPESSRSTSEGTNGDDAMSIDQSGTVQYTFTFRIGAKRAKVPVLNQI